MSNTHLFYPFNKVVIDMISKYREDFFKDQDTVWKRIALELSADPDGEPMRYQDLSKYFKSSLVFQLSHTRLTEDQELIDRLQFPYLRKVYVVQIHLLKEGPKEVFNRKCNVEDNKLFIKYLANGNYDPAVVAAFKRRRKKGVRVHVYIDVSDPVYGLPADQQKLLMHMHPPTKKCATKKRRQAEPGTWHDAATGSPIILDGVAVPIEPVNSPTNADRSVRTLLEEESLDLNTQEFDRIIKDSLECDMPPPAKFRRFSIASSVESDDESQSNVAVEPLATDSDSELSVGEVVWMNPSESLSAFSIAANSSRDPLQMSAIILQQSSQLAEKDRDSTTSEPLFTPSSGESAKTTTAAQVIALPKEPDRAAPQEDLVGRCQAPTLIVEEASEERITVKQESNGYESDFSGLTIPLEIEWPPIRRISSDEQPGQPQRERLTLGEEMFDSSEDKAEQPLKAAERNTDSDQRKSLDSASQGEQNDSVVQSPTLITEEPQPGRIVLRGDFFDTTDDESDTEQTSEAPDGIDLVSSVNGLEASKDGEQAVELRQHVSEQQEPEAAAPEISAEKSVDSGADHQRKSPGTAGQASINSGTVIEVSSAEEEHGTAEKSTQTAAIEDEDALAVKPELGQIILREDFFDTTDDESDTEQTPEAPDPVSSENGLEAPKEGEQAIELRQQVPEQPEPEAAAPEISTEESADSGADHQPRSPGAAGQATVNSEVEMEVSSAEEEHGSAEESTETAAIADEEASAVELQQGRITLRDTFSSTSGDESDCEIISEQLCTAIETFTKSLDPAGQGEQNDLVARSSTLIAEKPHQGRIVLREDFFDTTDDESDTEQTPEAPHVIDPISSVNGLEAPTEEEEAAGPRAAEISPEKSADSDADHQRNSPGTAGQAPMNSEMEMEVSLAEEAHGTAQESTETAAIADEEASAVEPQRGRITLREDFFDLTDDESDTEQQASLVDNSRDPGNNNNEIESHSPNRPAPPTPRWTMQHHAIEPVIRRRLDLYRSMRSQWPQLFRRPITEFSGLFSLTVTLVEKLFSELRPAGILRSMQFQKVIEQLAIRIAFGMTAQDLQDWESAQLRSRPRPEPIANEDDWQIVVTSEPNRGGTKPGSKSTKIQGSNAVVIVLSDSEGSPSIMLPTRGNRMYRIHRQ